MSKSKVNNSNALLFEFWGLKQPTPADSTVKVWTDPDVLKTTKVKKSSSEDLDLGEFSSKQSRMGFAKAQQKEERMMRLRKVIDDKSLTTVQEALKEMPDVKTKVTIIEYLKIIGRELLDEETGKMKGSPVANFSGVKTKKGKKFKLNYKYYTADPDLGGIEIPHEQYVKHRKSLVNTED